MLQVLISFCIIFLITYGLGYVVIGLFCQAFGEKGDFSYISYYYVIFGLISATVYGEIWSLFFPVSLGAFCTMGCITLIIYIKYRKEIALKLKQEITNIKMKPAKAVIKILVLALTVYATSRGYIHFDTNLYHAQAIRWIEEYGIVPGLANLQQRFGYNSSEFALTALFGFKWIANRSLHTTAGFFVLLAALISVDIDFKRVSGYVRIAFLFYYFLIFGEIVSPASDYYAQGLLFVLAILWLELWEEKKGGNSLRLSLLSLSGIFGATIKLSTGLYSLLALLPFIILLKSKKYKAIILCIGETFLITIPFFIRNIIISGYILYPSTFLDIFDFDWKVPRSDVIFDANEIGVYGKGYTDISHYLDPISKWVPHWFDNLAALEKLLVVITVISIIIVPVILIKDLNKFNDDIIYYTLFASTFLSGCIWFFRAPLIRYGYIYILMLPAMAFGLLVKKINRPVMYPVIVLCFCMFMVLKIKDVAVMITKTYREPYYLYQKDYDYFEVDKVSLDGVNIYIGTEKGQSGYYYFPSVPELPMGTQLRGKDLKEGFVRIK